MKAIIYARVSSKEQEETGFSLPAQEKLLREYAQRQGFEVVKVFSVAESASGAKQRRVFAEMMEHLTKKGVSHLLCEKVDRLTRNLKEAVIANDWIEDNDTRKIHFVKQNLVLHRYAKSDEKFRWDIEIILAKKYISNLSEEVKKGQAEKIAQGWLPAKPPLGYITVGEKGHKTHEIDPVKGPFVREMFELYSTGQYSLRQLCKVMEKKGLRSALGYPIVKSRMAELLSDPFYYGAMRWNDVVYSNAKQQPLISKGLFDEVQHMLHKGSAPKFSKHLYTFKGFIKCTECGGLVTWEKQKGIIYGHCNGYKPCTKRTWYKEVDVVEKLAEAFGKLLIKSKNIANWLRDALKESGRAETEIRQSKVDALQAQIAHIETKLSRAYEDRLDDRISTEAYDKKAKQLEQERRELQEEVLRHQDAGDETRELRVEIYNLSQAAPEIFKNATPEKRRDLIGLVFEKLEMVDGKLAYTFKEPFAALEKAAKETNSSKVPKLLRSPLGIFELVENGSKKEKDVSSDLEINTLLRRQDSNLEPTP